MTSDALKRLYYFYEAMALYDLYYENVVDVLASKKCIVQDARPITWVPLVFHCTSLKALREIVAAQKIEAKNGYVSLTECPIDQLDRFRVLRKDFEVAIGFPRVRLEGLGLFQPLYLKHASPETRAKFKKLPMGYVEADQDLGAFSEVRVPQGIDLEEAVWILCSQRNEEREIDNSDVIKISRDLGIPRSYWHRSHLEGIIKENIYRKVLLNENGSIKSLNCMGEFYFKKNIDTKVVHDVRFPGGKSFKLKFDAYDFKDGWEGPFTNIQMAQFFYRELTTHYPDESSGMRKRIDFAP